MDDENTRVPELLDFGKERKQVLAVWCIFMLNLYNQDRRASKLTIFYQAK